MSNCPVCILQQRSDPSVLQMDTISTKAICCKIPLKRQLRAKAGDTKRQPSTGPDSNEALQACAPIRARQGALF